MAPKQQRLVLRDEHSQTLVPTVEFLDISGTISTDCSGGSSINGSSSGSGSGSEGAFAKQLSFEDLEEVPQRKALALLQYNEVL